MIEVRISDEMAVVTMIDDCRSVAKSEPVYLLTPVRRIGKHSTIYAGSRESWEAWLKICEHNATGAIDDPKDRRTSAACAERIAAALKEATR